MDFQTELINNVVTVRLNGSLYVDDAATLRASLLNYIAQGNSRFIIDLSDTDYIDSAGLGVLVAIHKRAVQHHGSVTIRGLQGVVKELFELTRLTQVFYIE